MEKKQYTTSTHSLTLYQSQSQSLYHNYIPTILSIGVSPSINRCIQSIPRSSIN